MPIFGEFDFGRVRIFRKYLDSIYPPRVRHVGGMREDAGGGGWDEEDEKRALEERMESRMGFWDID